MLDLVLRHASAESLEGPGGLYPARSLCSLETPGSDPQAEGGLAPASLHAEGSTSVGLAGAGGRAGSWSLELSERGAGGAAGGAPQPLQRTGVPERLRHAASGETFL